MTATDFDLSGLDLEPKPHGAALDECIATFRRWLHLPDPGALQVMIATVAANGAAGDPVWLLVVGPPGGGKTELIQTLAKLPRVKPAATLTEAALLSGTPAKEKTHASTGGLLRELGDFGIILAKDFGSVLSMHRDERAKVLAALREIYDGSWTRHVGTDGGKTLTWAGKVGLIAGVTPAIDSHHAVIGSMGERFVLYRLAPVDGDKQARRALAHVGHEKAMRVELAAAVALVLDHVDEDLLVDAPDEESVERLIRLATVAVRCRSAVERDSYNREVELIPEPEAPGRLALVLLRIRNALRAIGVTDADAWALVGKIALDSMPAIRRKVLDVLLVDPDPMTTSAVSDRTSYPANTARRALEDLAAHGILHKASQGQGKADLWSVTDWARERLGTLPETSGGEGHRAPDEPEADPISSLPHMNDDISGTPPASTWDPSAPVCPACGQRTRTIPGDPSRTHCPKCGHLCRWAAA